MNKAEKRYRRFSAFLFFKLPQKNINETQS